MKKKVLIIEDEKLLARALELELSRQGFTVVIALDGETGLSALEKEAFDLIVCDLVMPKVDGFRVLEVLKERFCETPCIVLSNLSQDQDIKKSKELGAKAFLLKSNISIARLVEDMKIHIH